MDHVIDYINDCMYSDVENLKAEYKNGQYKRLSECPSYSRVKAYCDAVNVLVREYHIDEYIGQFSTSPTRKINNN